ncbi:MAG: AI-2E family transporter [Nitrospirae bacterium]|nr:AI-2E family transporter [Nitrospirota bacterium]
MEIDRKKVTAVVLVVISVLVLYGAHLVFKPFYKAILWAVIAGVTFWPLNRKLRLVFRGKGMLSSLISVACVLLFFLVPSAFIITSLVTQVSYMYEKVYPQIPFILDRISQLVPVEDAGLKESIISGSRDAGKFIAGYVSSATGDALSILFQMSVAVLILYFIFRDGESFIKKLMDSPLVPSADVEIFVRETGEVIRAVIYGVVFTAMLQGLLGGIGFWVTGLPAPVLFGAIMFITAIVPFAGTVIVWGPASIYLIYYGMTGRGIFLIIWGILAVGMIDNFLRPYFISKRLGFHVILSFIGIIGGMSAFGFAGIFLGPLLLTLLIRLIEKYSGLNA